MEVALDADLSAAAASGQCVVGTVEDLLADDGLAIPNADDVFVVLRPIEWMGHGPSMAHAATAPLQPAGGPIGIALFESSEHVILAENARLTFTGGRNEGAVSCLLHMPNGLALTYGQVIALAGDFYGDPTRPISDQSGPIAQQAQFLTNFTQLAEASLALTEVPAILKTLHEEFLKVSQVIAQGRAPSAAYQELGDELSSQWNRDTGGGTVGWLPFGRYLNLATTNWDHFGADAWTCYVAGHTVALQRAAAANSDAELELAYAINAFADHFLTDIFSAGHMRTPRRQMYEQATSVWVPGVGNYKDLASLMARIMHDEDSRFGLWVENSRGDVWVAYGDKRYRDPADYANAVIVQDAVQASIAEVYAAFVARNPNVPQSVSGYVPNLQVDWTDRRNFSPLFLYDTRRSTTVLRRNNVASMTDYSWTTSWWVWSTWLLLKVRASGPPVDPNVPSSGPFTGSSWSTGITGAPPGMTGLTPTGPDLVGVKPGAPIGPGGPSGPVGP